MSIKERLWIQYMLADLVHANILANVGIWGTVFVSLFNYQVNHNMYKAMISFWNHKTQLCYED